MTLFKSHHGDPFPYTNGQDRFTGRETFPFNLTYMPRPEYDTLPVNRVLEEFYDERRFILNSELWFAEWKDWLEDDALIARVWGDIPATELEFAREVITRLHNLHKQKIGR